jgi:hypothetical protein
MNNYNGGDEDDNIRTIEIMIETNNNKTPFPLTYSKIITSSKPDNIEIPGQQLPYFAPHIKYPKAYLEGKNYPSILKTFFDRTSFINNVVANGTPTTDYKVINENIVLMLNLLYPNTYPIQHNITTSFDKYLKQQRSQYRGNNITKLKKMMYGEQSEHAKLSANETISEIIWINDVINDPMYNTLMRQLKEYAISKDKARKNYESDKKTIDDKIKTALTDKNSDTYFTDSDINNLKQKINIFDLDTLNNEMNIILKKYMQALPKEDAAFQTKLKDMINYFISANNAPIKSFSDFETKFDFKIDANTDMFQYFESYKSSDQNKDAFDRLNSEIETLSQYYDSQKRLFKEEHDKNRMSLINDLKTLTINNLGSVEKALTSITEYNKSLTTANKTNKQRINTGWSKTTSILETVSNAIKKYKERDDMNRNSPLFSWVGVSIKSTTIDTIKKDLNPQITSLKRELWVSIQKYNESNRWSNVEYSSQKKIAKQINDMITTMSAIRKIQNIGNVKDIRANIVSLLDNIKILGRETAVSSIIQKVEKIKQLVDDKIGLELIREYILDAPGILYKYNEIRFDTENKNIFDYELRKEKYSFFVNTVNNINKDLFQNIESMNPDFQSLLKDYLDNKSNEFYKNIVVKSYEIENPQKNNSVSIDDTMNISVLKNNAIYNKNDANKNNAAYKNDANKYNAAYKINVYMEVILGNLDEKTMGELNCQYKDKNLISRFLELMNPVKTYKIVKREPFNVETAKTEIKKKKKAKEEKIQSVKSKTAKRGQMKTGGYTRRNR